MTGKQKDLRLIRFKLYFLKNVLRLLGITGFGMLFSCSKYEPIVEYGVNPADFIFKGTITDEITHDPIKGIVVKITAQPGDTLGSTTDENGKYSINKTTQENQIIKIICKDKDGMANGWYESNTVYVTVSSNDAANNVHEENIQLTPEP